MMFSYRKLSKIMAGSLLMLASLADASAVYNSEAQGKSQAAAVGNLRMNALRDSLKKLLPPDAVKQNARVIRNEVILKVNIYTSVDEDSLTVKEAKGKYLVSGPVTVDEDNLITNLKGIPGVGDKLLVTAAAGSPDAGKKTDGTETGVSSDVVNNGSDNDVTDEEYLKVNVSLPATVSDKNIIEPAEFMELISEQDDDKIIDYLKQGMNPNVLSENKRPALYEYLNAGGSNYLVVYAFIGAGADIMMRDENGSYALLERICSSGDPVLEKVLDVYKPVLKDIKFADGGTPLTVFLGNSFYRHGSTASTVRILDKLLKAGVDPNARIPGTAGEPVLFRTIISGSLDIQAPEVLKRFMEAKPDLEAKDGAGRTALFVAVENNAPAQAAMLIESGASVNAVNNAGYTVLASAAGRSGDNQQMIDLLLDHGADANVPAGEDRSTVLMNAVKAGNENTVKSLLAHKSDPNISNRDGNSALSLALSAFDLDKQKGIIEALLKAGANPNAADTDGYTPLFYALTRGNVNIVKLLAENGGDLAAAAGTRLPAAEDEEQVTLYDFISQQDAPEMAELKAYLKEKLGK